MNNLFQRFITSLVMLLFLSISLFLNKYIWLFTLILVSLVLFIEFNNLTKKIWKKEKNIIVSLNTLSLLFLIILIYVSYVSYYIPPVGLVFIISICIFSDTGGYIIGNLIHKKKNSKLFLIIGITISLGILFFFKYFNFFVSDLGNINTSNTIFSKIILPIGISFYTFQSISYLVDIYKKKIDPTNLKNLFCTISYYC